MQMDIRLRALDKINPFQLVLERDFYLLLSEQDAYIESISMDRSVKAG